MPRTACQQCAQDIEFPAELAGQKIDCPSCGHPTPLSRPEEPLIRIPANAPKPAFAKGNRSQSVPAEPVAAPLPASPAAAAAKVILDNVEKVIVGKRQEILLTLVAYFSEGHILLEDVPGVAKTMLARALARSVGCTFKRLQCTPDLLPTDITGASIFNPKTVEFEFRPGPLFAQVVLADEINRATPRTQSALLEAMSERQVTVDGVNYPLEAPFLILATQNPIDHEGTFPLPEAQLDRFLVRLTLGYPSQEEETRLLHRLQLQHPIETLEAVVTAQQILDCQKAVREVHVDEKVREYTVGLIRATREHHSVALGASPRAALALLRAAQALAAIHGDDYVLPDYVKQLAPAVLTHRMIIRPESRIRKITASNVLEEILNHIAVPTLAPTR